MRHLKAINRKARRVDEFIASEYGDVHALAGQQGPPQPPRPHYPLGCSLVFSPGWETDSAGGTAGLCQPVERDRLLYNLLLARAGARSLQQLSRLDEQMRQRDERLAQHRPRLPVRLFKRG